VTPPRINNKESDVAKEIERGRAEMEREWQIRQQNVLPLPSAWNERRFYGRALKGNRQLTGVQRVGLFLLGLQGIGIPLMFLFGRPALPAVAHPLRIFHHEFTGVSVVWLPVYLIYMLLGVRFCWVALRRNQPPKREEGATGLTN
jgi:hypothetical protein